MTQSYNLMFEMILIIFLLSSACAFIVEKFIPSSIPLRAGVVLSRDNDFSKGIIPTKEFGGSSSLLYVDVKPKYWSAPSSSREQLSRKLTGSNRRYADEGVEFRVEYLKLRLLTVEEEMVAGKFSRVGKRLEEIKVKLEEKLGRSAQKKEWATSCKLSLEQFELYYEMAKQARQRLIHHNIRLVDFWARRLIEHSPKAKEISYYELLIEGIIGLADAANSFDGRGRFLKYAQPFIRNKLYRGMTRLRPGNFLSHHTMMLSYRANRMRSRLHQELQRKPTDEEIAAKMGLRVETLRKVLSDVKLKGKVISAETNLGARSNKSKGDNFVTYLDLFLKADQTNIATESSQWRSDFHQLLDCLSPIERRTLSLRYGLDDGNPRSIERTAELMCVSEEGLRKIILRAIEKLRSSPLSLSVNKGPPSPSTMTTNGRLAVIPY